MKSKAKSKVTDDRYFRTWRSRHARTFQTTRKVYSGLARILRSDAKYFKAHPELNPRDYFPSLTAEDWVNILKGQSYHPPFPLSGEAKKDRASWRGRDILPKAARSNE